VGVPPAVIGFGEFVQTRSRDLLRTGWLLTGDWALAQELVQTALLGCLPRWDSVSAPDAYVRAAIVNAYLSWRRRRSASERPSTTMPDTPGPDELARADVRASVRGALAALSARERTVVVLRYYADLSEADTAAALGIAAGSVKRYAADALAKLRVDPALGGLLTEEVTE
jgi:RNA polymerase sigma-70 factor (sigma-E family)